MQTLFMAGHARFHHHLKSMAELGAARTKRFIYMGKVAARAGEPIFAVDIVSELFSNLFVTYCALFDDTVGFEASGMLAVATYASHAGHTMFAELPVKSRLNVAPAAQLHRAICRHWLIGVTGGNRGMASNTVYIVFFPRVCSRIVSGSVAGHTVSRSALRPMALPAMVILIGKMALAARKTLPMGAFFP